MCVDFSVLLQKYITMEVCPLSVDRGLVLAVLLSILLVSFRPRNSLESIEGKLTNKDTRGGRQDACFCIYSPPTEWVSLFHNIFLVFLDTYSLVESTPHL